MTPPGNTCPYCRSPIESKESAKECPSCGTAHHADCWAENGGCAVVGCSMGPAAKAEPEIVLPPIDESSSTVVVDVGAGEGKRGRGALPIVAALAVVAMVAIGVGAAVVIRDAGKGDPIEVSEASGGRALVAGEEGPPAGARPTAPPAAPDEFSDAEVVKGAEDVLLRHHEFLEKAQGDPNSPYARRAFGLLSARKRSNEANEVPGESGFEFWITKNEEENLSIGEEVCLPGSVSLHSPAYPGLGYWDPRNGVAMVYVDYGTYAGFTWVLYEHGHWTYDAGYGHVPSREHWQDEPEALFKKRSESC